MHKTFIISLFGKSYRGRGSYIKTPIFLMTLFWWKKNIYMHSHVVNKLARNSYFCTFNSQTDPPSPTANLNLHKRKLLHFKFPPTLAYTREIFVTYSPLPQYKTMLPRYSSNKNISCLRNSSFNVITFLCYGKRQEKLVVTWCVCNKNECKNSRGCNLLIDFIFYYWREREHTRRFLFI